ncbi:MAG: TolC family protein [Dokdonella sp.]|uniref:TolC family protein n=1 Tax=Dokdonella sp. TaxID=2291710 RepID=UPI003263BF66
MHKLKLPALVALSAAIAACTVGPDYVRPVSPTPTKFARSETSVNGVAADALPIRSDAEFWRGFDDPQLTRLVDESLRANHDLRIALATYDRANALLRGAKFDQWPVITASADASDGRASADQLPGVGREARDAKTYSAGINATWELDFFGRIRRGVEAQSADTQASAADLAAAQVAIVGDVARTYVELRGLQERLRVAQGNADNQRETLNLVDARFDAGRDTDFDTSRARAQLETTLARIPALEAQVGFAMHRLGVLVGQTPDALIAELTPQKSLPALPARLDPGTPGELLRNRPDVAAAELRLHASTARIGVATADLFPRFTLGGLLGTQAISAGNLFERDSETRLVALGVDWSFLDIGHVRARIAASDADAGAQLARYEQTVLLALEDTENALVRYSKARSEDEHLERAATDSAVAARLARVRYEAGAAGLFEVLDAERNQLEAQDAFADARTRAVTGAVGLYKAMAGGWPAHVPRKVDVANAASPTTGVGPG